MNKELEFPWKYFMGSGLKVNDGDGNEIEYAYCNDDMLLNFKDVDANGDEKQFYTFDCTPLVVDPKSLSDEELQYIFGVNFKVNRKDHLVYLRECRINLKTGHIHPCDQQILNRLYSLHSLPNYEELLKAGIIEDAGDCYE